MENYEALENKCWNAYKNSLCKWKKCMCHHKYYCFIDDDYLLDNLSHSELTYVKALSKLQDNDCEYLDSTNSFMNKKHKEKDRTKMMNRKKKFRNRHF